MIVVDTSALVEFLVGGDVKAKAVRRLAATEVIAAPQGVDLECLAALRGLTMGGKLDDGEAQRAIRLLGRLDLRRYDVQPLASRIWALRHNMWPYDAAFVALAELLDVPLVTVDAKFATVPDVRCRVEVIG